MCAIDSPRFLGVGMNKQTDLVPCFQSSLVKVIRHRVAMFISRLRVGNYPHESTQVLLSKGAMLVVLGNNAAA